MLTRSKLSAGVPQHHSSKNLNYLNLEKFNKPKKNFNSPDIIQEEKSDDRTPTASDDQSGMINFQPQKIVNENFKISSHPRREPY